MMRLQSLKLGSQLLDPAAASYPLSEPRSQGDNFICLGPRLRWPGAHGGFNSGLTWFLFYVYGLSIEWNRATTNNINANYVDYIKVIWYSWLIPGPKILMIFF